MKWAFIYILDDPSDAQRIDRIGTLVCVGVPAIDDAAAVAKQLIAEGWNSSSSVVGSAARVLRRLCLQ